MLQLNTKNPAYITDEQSKARVEVRYHSLSRKSGYVYVVEKDTGKFRQVRMTDVRYL